MHARGAGRREDAALVAGWQRQQRAAQQVGQQRRHDVRVDAVAQELVLFFARDRAREPMRDTLLTDTLATQSGFGPAPLQLGYYGVWLVLGTMGQSGAAVQAGGLSPRIGGMLQARCGTRGVLAYQGWTAPGRLGQPVHRQLRVPSSLRMPCWAWAAA